MKIFIVNRKYYIDNLKYAILKAKEIIAEKAISPINNCWLITQGKKGGYCVKLLDDWSKVGITCSTFDEIIAKDRMGTLKRRLKN